MDYYVLFLAIVAAAIGSFMIFRKFRFHQENEEIDSSSFSSSSVASSSLTPLSLSDAPSLLSHNWTHQVFPSFRGEDVRKDFLSHILKEFKRKAITPFIDNEIKRGESIAPELIQSIRGSKIAIILLSKNYASSKWCLNELVEIMSCRKELGQTVMVIFYKVDPSHVKKLDRDFGKVFKKTCVGQSNEDIRRWKEALAEVATIAGYHSINWNNEAEMIEQIATDVSNVLMNIAPSDDFNSWIGMTRHMGKIEPFLPLDSDEARILGIWGPSGIGKTTIARFIFTKYADQFQLIVFMENIKRRYPGPYSNDYNAKLQLQKEFWSEITSQKDVKINHLGVAQHMLKVKRVLVVLDDVDHLLQLDALAIEFGRGSWTIITTQDKRILNAYGVDYIYEVGFPCDGEALQIFCMNAFGQSFPFEGFEHLAWEATKLSGNLPLGLQVMGSYFKGMDKDMWKMELPRLRTNLDRDIESILKFSYNALFEEDKCLFLYIACYFNYVKIEKVEAHLETNFSNVRRGLQVLAEKSLIYIDLLGHIRMHDLLTRLGREIDRKQSIEKRQFLLESRDISQILSNDSQANRSVVGMDFIHSEIEDELHQTDIHFDRMYALQFVRIWGDRDVSKSYLPHKTYHLPRKVKLLHWEHCPMRILPLNFNAEFLVELNMPHSKLEKLWQGIKIIPNLKWIDLNSSKYLNELADLSNAINLKKLNLESCSSLVELPSSIGNAINLIRLNLEDCSSLVELPSSIGNAINLKQLYLRGCSSLMKLPSSIENAINLEKLNLKGCSSLVELSSSIGNVINLKELNLDGCSSLVELPSSIGNVINLENLSLDGCSSLVELPSSIGNAINLEVIDLSGCSRLVELPSSIGNAINLRVLDLSRCSRLVELPSSIGNAINLKRLALEDCSSLVELPFSIGNAINLEKLELKGCSSLVELPSSIGNIINLKRLNLYGCSRLVELPSSIGNVINLEELNLDGCSSLVELPSSIGNAISNLEILNFKGCSSLVELPSSIGNAINLEVIDLKGCSSLVELPSSIGNAINLTELDLQGCSSLVKLPSSIGRLDNLLKLYLGHCSKLLTFPTNTSMKSLDELNLRECSLLKHFPEISTNIRVLKLNGTAIKEIPSSIKLWARLNQLSVSYSENLKEFPHVFDFVTKLHLSDTRIQEIAPWIKRMNRLRKLVIRGCTKLVSLPELPESVTIIDAKNCESLETLNSSFQNQNTEFYKDLNFLNFANCFKLNKEARDLIINSTCTAVLPGDKVPRTITYRAIGSSLSVTLNGIDTDFPRSIRFKACFLLVNKSVVELNYKPLFRHPFLMRKKRNNNIVLDIFQGRGGYLNEHLYIFDFQETITSSELVVEFRIFNDVNFGIFDDENWEIRECGLSTPTLLVDKS